MTFTETVDDSYKKATLLNGAVQVQLRIACDDINGVRLLLRKYPGAARAADDALLIDACELERWDIATMLIDEFGCDINARGGKILLRAALNKTTDPVRFILDKGADPTINETLVRLATTGGLENRVNVIILPAIQARQQDQQDRIREDVFSLRQRLADEKVAVLRKILLQNPELARAQDEALLREACSLARTDIATLLIDEFECDVNVGEGAPLLLATITRRTAMVRFLLSKGADPTLNNRLVHNAIAGDYDAEINSILLHAIQVYRDVETVAKINQIPEGANLTLDAARQKFGVAPVAAAQAAERVTKAPCTEAPRTETMPTHTLRRGGPR
jgi:hypothetical protein